MKLAVEFPSVAYREGPEGVARLAREIERIGFDQLDMFDHVVMGLPTGGRSRGPYPPQMPIMEALMTLSFVAAVTSKIGLGTEVLVLPQRQPVLVAKQISTLDTLSKGRVRLGVGVGWQEAEYEALGMDFHTRGEAMDEAIGVLRAYWGDAEITTTGKHFPSRDIVMEPKPPQGRNIPIWIGGGAPAALKRVGKMGDGWLGTSTIRSEKIPAALATIKASAEKHGRDPAKIGLQMMLDTPPRSDDVAGKSFYKDADRVAARALAIRESGFQWATINMTAVFQSGARSMDAMVETLGTLHERIRQETA